MDVFYCENIQEDDPVLGPGESQHCIRVLRYREGDRMILVDGRGTRAEARVLKPDPVACVLKVDKLQAAFGKTSHTIQIGIAPPKSHDRFEFFLEKATEIGVDTITPLICARSERKAVRRERAERIILAAMKQSGRAYLPVLEEEQEFEPFLAKARFDTGLIASCSAPRSETVKKSDVQGKHACILIGPEGDFTGEERSLSRIYRFREVSLGAAVLRTETAGIVACTLLNHLRQ